MGADVVAEREIRDRNPWLLGNRDRLVERTRGPSNTCILLDRELSGAEIYPLSASEPATITVI
jgi:hypothetical protein